MKRLLATTCLTVSAALLGACATSSPDVISPYQTQQMSTVIDAVVLSVRPVTVGGQQSGVGTVAGAAVGAAAGSSVGGYRDSFVGGILGAVVGGVLGNAVERNATTAKAVELTLQLRNGERRAVVQAEGSETFAPGDSVMVIQTGNRVRVTKSPVTLMPAPAAARP